MKGPNNFLKNNWFIHKALTLGLEHLSNGGYIPAPQIPTFTYLLSVRMPTFSVVQTPLESPKSFYWTFDKWFPKLVAKAGICSAHFHDLRKTCNTIMKENSVPIEVAMQILGHSTIKVNQEYYTGVLTEQQRIAINSLPSIG